LSPENLSYNPLSTHPKECPTLEVEGPWQSCMDEREQKGKQFYQQNEKGTGDEQQTSFQHRYKKMSSLWVLLLFSG
jgi:hypothetical protein